MLKIQLNEASRFGRIKDFAYQRLAVILLDNFIEIQLRTLMDAILFRDGLSYILHKKYKQKDREKIICYHGELLKTCVKELIITQEEKQKIAFCHNVRNNLYHTIDEDKLLVKISLILLHNIITKNKVLWGNGLGITSLKGKNFDPFVRKRQRDSAWFNSNTKEEWQYFFKRFFNFIDKREKNIQALLKENIKRNLKRTRKNISFIKKDFSIFFPYAKNWKFNEYCLYYSFHIINKKEIRVFEEDKLSGEKKYKELFLKYKNNWKKINKSRISEINNQANLITNLSESKALEKYITIMTELKMISDVFEEAARDLDKQIQAEIDLVRGK
ncbi:MAG: hypothetical protein PHT51_00410 [Patescibacteria group bacterium]|nr:hypothetical protein [Patescibacteria group bacterium]MDD4611043.1 hypothetical protein [Patescibacteria group bacterium]